MKNYFTTIFCVLLAAVAHAAPTPQASITALRSASGVQAASPAMQQAWRKVAAMPPSAMPSILRAMQDAGPTAQNWLRSAADAVAEQALAQNQPLPVSGLQQLVADPHQSPRARRAAYEWLVKVDQTTPDKYLPGMLNDPSIELRFDAVQRVIDQALADNVQEDKKAVLLDKALNAALDQGQLEASSKELGKLGRKVDLAEVMGFLADWKLIGPFDNSGGKGFDRDYPPESKLDLTASYEGKQGAVAWQDATSEGDLGRLDITETLGPEKGAVAYVYADFYSDKAQAAELRYSSHNATKAWVNGKLVASNQVYHAGNPLDQYRGRVRLKQGKNRVLVKVCQNEQTEPWAQDWELQLRFTDLLGKGLKPATPDDTAATQTSKGVLTY